LANDADEVTEKLNWYMFEALEELRLIAKDKKHPSHLRHGFAALQAILKHTAPIRKDAVPPKDGDVNVQIANLFHGDSLDEPKKQVEAEIVDKDLSEP
jgi:hypothetical protein